MLIRHAEKPLHTGRAHGVSMHGDHDSDSLTVEGWVRAGGLAALFALSDGEPRAPLLRPDAIYGAAHRGHHSKRSIQTITPLAARLGLKVVSCYGEGDEKKLAHELRAHQGVALVSWHHESIPNIVAHLGPVFPTPPSHWPDDRYDLVWTFTEHGSQWRFGQVPQLLLPGDLTSPIAG
jgi:hypothetical protein